ncbi:MAG TPA: DUF167 domain-containing protein [Nitrospirota bacterium]|nr:DUF167 domain-containing protein [Nitrospirota bacterium]
MLKKSSPRNEAAPATALLPIRIQPRASKNEIVLMQNGGLKIRLTAPPVDGAANEALAKFLAERLSIAKSRVEIVSGHTGREKVIKISGMSREDVVILLNVKKESGKI